MITGGRLLPEKGMPIMGDKVSGPSWNLITSNPDSVQKLLKLKTIESDPGIQILKTKFSS
jgi:hypothetical protein